jgi:hypothetical protein
MLWTEHVAMLWPEPVAFMWWMDLNLLDIMLLDIKRWIWTYDGYFVGYYVMNGSKTKWCICYDGYFVKY